MTKLSQYLCVLILSTTISTGSYAGMSCDAAKAAADACGSSRCHHAADYICAACGDNDGTSACVEAVEILAEDGTEKESKFSLWEKIKSMVGVGGKQSTN